MRYCCCLSRRAIFLQKIFILAERTLLQSPQQTQSHGTLTATFPTMRKSTITFFIILSLVSCKKSNSTNNVLIKPNPISQEFDLAELDTSEYDQVRYNDTTKYFNKGVTGIDGKNIVFDPNRYVEVSARAKFQLEFLQYTTDDKNAFPLDFKYLTSWIKLETENGVIKIPDFNGNSENVKLSSILGFKSNYELSESIAAIFFDSIKNESLSNQKSYYSRILNDKSEYKCCPEYIKQANSFLATSRNEFNTIEDLKLELNYNVILIEIKARTKSKDFSISKVIINK